MIECFKDAYGVMYVLYWREHCEEPVCFWMVPNTGEWDVD